MELTTKLDAAQYCALVDMLGDILQKQERIMSGLTDLQTFATTTFPAFAAQVGTDITALTTAVNGLITAVQAGGDNDAAVEAAVQQAQATLAGLQTDDAAIEAVTASANAATTPPGPVGATSSAKKA
jgi:hypothetical protein